MRILLLLLLLLLLLQPPPPRDFAALWQRAGVARLAWMQPAGDHQACLTRIPREGPAVALDCYHDIPAGARVVVLLGATGPMDGRMRPQAHDTFVLTVGETKARSLLRGIVRLPIMRR